MISHAQNFEDVMLLRALGARPTGFYIDVGAWHPALHSVTKAFYDMGWSGINVEPNPKFHGRLETERPRDTNLCLALAREAGRRTLHRIGDTGLSTLSAAELPRYQNQGRDIDPLEVPVDTLAGICRRHVTGPVDFLSVDVEGLEEEVLSGGDWRAFRPRIVLVEATRPLTPEPAWDGWEPVLLAQGYLFAYFDGLNRFYVREEDRALLAAFSVPPNVFDRFELAEVHSLRQEVQRLKSLLSQQRPGTIPG